MELGECPAAIGSRFLLSRLLSTNTKIKIYRTVILPVVLYGSETWSVTFRDERKLGGVCVNWVLRNVFGVGGNFVTSSMIRTHHILVE